MSNVFMRLSIAAENLNEPEVEITDESSAAPTSLETDMLELGETSSELNAASGGVSELGDASDEAAEIAEEVSETVQEEGELTESAAAHAIERLSLIMEKFNLPPIKNKAFEADNKGVGVAQTAGLVLRHMGRKLWAMLKRICEIVIDFISKLFGLGNNLEKRAEDILKRSGELKSESGGVIKNAKIAKAVDIGGHPDVSANGLSLVESKTAESVAQQEALSKDLEEITKLHKGSSVNPTAFNAAAEKYMHRITTNIKWVGKPEAEGDKTICKTTGLPGDAVVWLSYKASDKYIISDFAAGVEVNKEKAASKEELPSLNKASIKTICEHAKNIGKALASSRSMLTTLNATVKLTADVMNVRTGNEVEGADANDTTAQAHVALNNMVKLGAHALTHPYTQFASYALSTSKQYLDWCEMSIKQHASGAASSEKPAT